MILYHVTENKNLENIMKVGLEPHMGYLSQIAEEEDFAIYLFKDIDQVENDINTWMKLVYRKEDLILLKVTLPDGFGETWERFGWEVMCYTPIPPEYIEHIPFPGRES